MRFIYDKGQFHEEIYREESIPKRPGYPMPQEIRDIRALQQKEAAAGTSRAEIFVHMASFMAEYTDEFTFDMKIRRDKPAFDCLDDVMLRGYFGWRTLYRKGQIIPAETYPEIYAYELINEIETKDKYETCRILKKLAEDYPAYRRNINRYLTDFIIFNGLEPSMLPENDQLWNDKRVAALMGDDSIHFLKALYEAAEYPYEYPDKCRAWKISEDEFAKLVQQCFHSIRRYYDKHRKKGFYDDIFGRRELWPYPLISNAVVVSAAGNEEYIYKVNEVRAYHFNKNHWSVERYTPGENLIIFAREFINDIYSCLDGAKESSGKNAWRFKLIAEEVKAFRERKAREVKIDTGRLDAIRLRAAEIRDLLIVDEEMEVNDRADAAETDVSSEETSEETSEELLTADEKHFLKCIIDGKSLEEFTGKGMMLSILIDGINEKLYDVFGDSVICEDESPYIYEDYLEDIRRMIEN